MSEEFHWKIGEEDAWIDTELPESVVDLGKRRVPIRLLAVVSAVLLLILLVTYWRLESRAATVEAAFTDAVAANYRLIRQADFMGDVDLFDAQTDSNMPEPTILALEELVDARLLFDRSYLGWTGAGQVKIESVDFTPDLSRATLTTAQLYSSSGRKNISETFILRHRYSYLQVDGDWLLTDHNDDFWGNWDTYNAVERDFKLFYSERDGEFARRLAPDLSEFLVQFCHRLSEVELSVVHCPEGRRIVVSLRREPGVLLDVINGQQPLNSYYQRLVVHLPSPTLIGMPEDEGGYQALYQAYATQLAGAVWAVAAEDTPPDNDSLLERALLNSVYAELGAGNWPELGLPQEPGAQRGEWPGSSLALLCLDEALSGVVIVEYEPSTENWTESALEEDFQALDRLADNKGLLLHMPSDSSRDQSIAVVWHKDGSVWMVPEPRISESSEIDPSISVSPSGRHLVYSVYDTFNNVSHFYLLSLEDCPGGGCRWRALPGHPLWSPDGSHMLISRLVDGRLILANENGRTFADFGDARFPSWLDVSRFGYFRSDGANGEFGWPMLDAQLFIGNVRGGASHSLLSAESLRTFLQAKGADSIQAMMIVPGYLAPAANGMLSLMAFAYPPVDGDPESQAYRFLVDIETGATTLAPTAEVATDWSFSPDGRYVSAIKRSEGRNAMSLTWFETHGDNSWSLNLENPRRWFEQPKTEWSADGRWILVFYQGILTLIEPDSGIQHTVFPKRAGCFAANWMD